jgi:hypothetical protein
MTQVLSCYSIGGRARRVSAGERLGSELTAYYGPPGAGDAAIGRLLNDSTMLTLDSSAELVFAVESPW